MSRRFDMEEIANNIREVISSNKGFVCLDPEAAKALIESWKNISEGFSPGSWGFHEALHMASFFADAIDRELLEHPAIVAVPEWKELAEKSFLAMRTLYGEIAAKHIIGEELCPK